MTEFNLTILANWIISGSTYIHYIPKNNCAVVSPLSFDMIPDEGYVIPIGDPQSLEMAMGIDNFKVYVLS